MQQESILKRWSEIGSSYRFMHDRSYTKFEKLNLRFALPVIVISTVTGTANFAQGSFPVSWQPYVPLCIGFLNLSAGLLTTVAQFLRVSELLEGHRAASIAYSKFSRNISVELSLPREDRSGSGSEFINNSRAELDRLIEQTPNIPLEIIRLFGKKFSDGTFNKPDILTINEVDVFKDKKLMSMEAELKLMKQTEEMKRELLDTERVRRKSIMEEFAQKREMDEKIEEKKKEKHRNEKKQNVNIKSVQTKMNNLLEKLTRNDATGGIATPSSSDSDYSSDEEDVSITIIEKVCESTDNVVDSTENVVDSTENVVESVENVVDSTENVVDSTENVVESVENVVDSTENVVDSTENVILDTSRNVI